jgi:hypothetical protein
LIAAGILAATPAMAQWETGSNPNSHQNWGYTTNQGRYVQPHQQTNPNNTQYDNYNSRGNYNPSTGTYGKQAPKY